MGGRRGDGRTRGAGRRWAVCVWRPVWSSTGTQGCIQAQLCRGVSREQAGVPSAAATDGVTAAARTRRSNPACRTIRDIPVASAKCSVLQGEGEARVGVSMLRRHKNPPPCPCRCTCRTAQPAEFTLHSTDCRVCVEVATQAHTLLGGQGFQVCDGLRAKQRPSDITRMRDAGALVGPSQLLLGERWCLRCALAGNNHHRTVLRGPQAAAHAGIDLGRRCGWVHACSLRATDGCRRFGGSSAWWPGDKRTAGSASLHVFIHGSSTIDCRSARPTRDYSGWRQRSGAREQSEQMGSTHEATNYTLLYTLEGWFDASATNC